MRGEARRAPTAARGAGAARARRSRSLVPGGHPIARRQGADEVGPAVPGSRPRQGEEEAAPAVEQLGRGSIASSVAVDRVTALREALESVGWGHLAEDMMEQFGSLEKCREAVTAEDLGRMGVAERIEREDIMRALRGDGAKEGISAVLEAVGMQEYAALLVRSHGSLQACRSLGHEELKRLGVVMFSHRKAIIRAFRGSRQASVVSFASSVSLRSLGSSSDDEDAEIRQVLEQVGVTGITEALMAKCDSLKKCRDLSHADLRALGVVDKDKRDALILAFHETAKGADRSSKTSTLLARAGSDLDRAMVKQVLQSVKLERHLNNMSKHGFDTLERCQQLSHADLQRAGVSKGDQDKIIVAFQSISDVMDDDKILGLFDGPAEDNDDVRSSGSGSRGARPCTVM